MPNEISIIAKLAASVSAGTVVNVATSASFASIIGTGSAQFDHRSTVLAASGGAKIALPTGAVTINDAAKYFWVLIRNTSTVSGVQVLIEYSAGNYAVAGVIPADPGLVGSFFLTRMVGAASTYPRIALISANVSGATVDLPTVETVVCDA